MDAVLTDAPPWRAAIKPVRGFRASLVRLAAASGGA